MDHDSPRQLVDYLDEESTRLIDNLRQLVSSITPDLLYRRPPAVTIGENLLRSAAVLEQTFGGLTANLWDDPFEWTLPETLSTAELVHDYLSEVEAARAWFTVVFETLVKGSDYHGRAVATLKRFFE